MLHPAIKVIMVIIDAREAGATEMRMRPKGDSDRSERVGVFADRPAS
jgi:tRNA (Thr-GGU) A37 N-methylase